MLENNQENLPAVMPELTEFIGFEMLERPEELINYRYRIVEARNQLKNLMDYLDSKLLAEMKKRNIQEVIIGEQKIYFSKKKTEKITDTGVLLKLLENPEYRELIIGALSSGQSAWKPAQVKIISDTLGLDIVETKWEDKVEFKSVPLNKLQ